MQHAVIIELGRAALVAAGLAAVYAAVMSFAAGRTHRLDLLETSRRAATAVWLCVVLAAASLVSLLMLHDYSVRYVFQHASNKLPVVYTLAALWGGQEGSLLLWMIVLSTLSLVHVRTSRDPLAPWVTGVLMSVSCFFLFMLNVVSSPFLSHPLVLEDGVGLTPALQNMYMVIHPPSLYLGYVGTTVPFAYGIAALLTGRLGIEWLHSIRRWALFAWTFLTVGNLLGAAWAYHVLGWGGYWSWDPVENAALMPWLITTAYVHSVMIQEKRGMLRMWNVSLVTLAFLLSILGTSITRSGIITSVHSFAESDLGKYFFGFLAICMLVSLVLIGWRRRMLSDETALDTYVSREGAFLLNNWVLTGGCVAVLIGTLLPAITEAIQGNKLAVDAPFFNRVMVPVGLSLLLLSGIGPLVSWRRVNLNNLRRNFVGPAVVGVGAAVVLVLCGIRHPAGTVALAFCAFVAATLVQEFWRGTRGRSRQARMGLPAAFVDLFRHNRRRYGGYVVHSGLVLVFMGIAASSAFQLHADHLLKPGESFDLQQYHLTFQGTQSYQVDRRSVLEATLDVRGPGGEIRQIHPRKDHFMDSDQFLSQIALWPSPRQDLYVVVQSMDAQGAALIRAWVNPMVFWIWLGGALMVLGGGICLAPDSRAVVARVVPLKAARGSQVAAWQS